MLTLETAEDRLFEMLSSDDYMLSTNLLLKALTNIKTATDIDAFMSKVEADAHELETQEFFNTGATVDLGDGKVMDYEDYEKADLSHMSEEDLGNYIAALDAPSPFDSIAGDGGAIFKKPIGVAEMIDHDL